MYSKLKGKKILIVGSTLEENVVKAAHEMGLYVAVADNVTDRKIARAKLIADEAWDVDYNDLELMLKLCREKGIDGVFAGYGEFRVLAACRIAAALNKPFYCTEEQVLMTANKRAFRKECEKHGISIPIDYCSGKVMTEEEKAAVQYPVIVKPSDRSGRIGISICTDRKQLDEAIAFALEKSVEGTYVVEEFLEGVEFAANYTVANGVGSLSSLLEKYITKDQRKDNFLCDCSLSPAYFIGEFEQEMDQKIKAFFKGIKLDNGMASFQGLYTKKGFYLFEMSLRLNGNNDWKFIEKTNGLNYAKMLMAYSITGNMTDDLSKDNPHFDKYFCTLPIYAHEGTIAKLDYSEIMKQEWAELSTLNVGVGNHILEDGTSRQKIVAILIEAEDISQLKERIAFVQNNLVVENEAGENMLFRHFDAGQLVAKE